MVSIDSMGDLFSPLPMEINRRKRPICSPSASLDSAAQGQACRHTAAFDTRYIGCEKHPQHNFHPISVGEVC